ncbi:MAG: DinB family protein [Dehalococcoidia bacterium]
MNAPDITQLDREDILSRSSRSRQALLDAVRRLPVGEFNRAHGNEWSAATLLRHVVWVEFYWTALVRELQQRGQPTLDIDKTVSENLAREASRQAGTPPEPLPEPPPYATRDEALRGLDDSRRAFADVVASLTADDLQRRFSNSRGVASLRFAVEHVIEHDWDHAVQIAGLRA